MNVLHEVDGCCDDSNSRPEPEHLARCRGRVEEVLGVVILIAAVHRGTVGQRSVDGDHGCPVDLGDVDDRLVELVVVSVPDQVIPELLVVNVVTHALGLLGAGADYLALLVFSGGPIVVAVGVAVRTVHVGAAGPQISSGPDGQTCADEGQGRSGAHTAWGAAAGREGDLGTAAVSTTCEARLWSGASVGVAAPVGVGEGIGALSVRKRSVTGT